MIKTWPIYPQTKNDTFNNRKLTFPFDITNCDIKMQFKQSIVGRVVFEWSTEDSTFQKISTTEIIMKSRLLNYPAGIYYSDLQVTFQDNTVFTYFNANLQIIQDITT
jgi:hypothetical protein